MKVFELIEQLLKLDPDLDVAIGYDCCVISDATEIQIMGLGVDGLYTLSTDITPTTVVIWDFMPEREEEIL